LKHSKQRTVNYRSSIGGHKSSKAESSAFGGKVLTLDNVTALSMIKISEEKQEMKLVLQESKVRRSGNKEDVASWKISEIGVALNLVKAPL
jgi:hypothetical protein